MLSAVNHVLLDQSALVDVTPLAEVHSILMQLSNYRIRLTLVAPRVSSGFPVILAAHATLPSSSWPILLLVVLLAIAEWVVNGPGVTQASEIANCDFSARWG
jgi:hypothetical protein